MNGEPYSLKTVLHCEQFYNSDNCWHGQICKFQIYSFVFYCFVNFFCILLFLFLMYFIVFMIFSFL